ncbi:O-glucosyltransferase 1-like [Micractinium conductrix]|uniref:O-glucosyltransferase 1-like n=1 Tax=Micractinium conductrix TaxID=554055 RepID=A0A2P6VRC5_9CHLO|nr:O-glucosyltransferase 1-like [Micractinium conductrix]|eukprot:PSC76631.1 O-glucosyltransferase 1-like [Micractinium conductrix]
MKLAAERSYYAQWIEKDLGAWRDHGITQEVVHAAAQLYDVCDGDLLRFQVLNGSLWVQHVTDRRKGWYPSGLGPGNLASKGRVPYAILALMDTLRMFPGQIPDVDAVLHTADFPCVRHSWDAGQPEGRSPMIVLGYQGAPTHHDLPFPDATFWGHEGGYLLDPWGNPAHGWAGQAALLHRKYEHVSLLDRIPQAMWRGRTQDTMYPFRDALRRKFVSCPKELRDAGRPDEATLFSVVEPPVVLQDSCDYRYNTYIESNSYASNLKQKLACGSVLLAPHPQHWEWFGRAMKPGQHYVEVTHEEDHVCEQTLAAVRDMNALFDSRGRRELPPGGPLTPSLAAALAAGQGSAHSGQQKSAALGRRAVGGGGTGAPGRLLISNSSSGRQPAAAEPQPSSDGSYVWRSDRMPWEVAASGQRFVREHVRMQDALLYIRDLLRSYAALQRFKPEPVKSTCYTGARLLEQFSTPHSADGEAVARAYPWLVSWDGGCKPGH